MNTDMMISLPTSSRCSARYLFTASASVDEYSEPGKLVEAGKDMRIAGSGPYAVMPHPTDGSVWYTLNVFAGPPGFLRLRPQDQALRVLHYSQGGIGVRGGDIDMNGVVWGSGSTGSLISFDRRKCKSPLNGANATGNHCPEGLFVPRFEGLCHIAAATPPLRSHGQGPKQTQQQDVNCARAK